MKNIVMNGLQGDSADKLLKNGFDVRALRPYEGKDGRSYLTQNHNGKPVSMVQNAPATLRKDDWITIDRAIVKVARERLTVVSDLRSAGLQHIIPNGMGTTVFQTETEGDFSDARISMSPLADADNDRPEYGLTSLPMPITHKGFDFDIRQIEASRKSGTPIDTSSAEQAGRKVAEGLEKLTLGLSGSFSYGGGFVYGMTNFPSRVTKVMTTPTGTGTNAATLTEILDMRQSLNDIFHFGPYVIYVSPAWDAFLDEDFSSVKGDITLRERILKLHNISSMKTADFLTGFQMIMVQTTNDVIREVVGMDLTTVQWDTQGGLMKHFKVMAIIVPQLRADFNGNSGIAHGTAP